MYSYDEGREEKLLPDSHICWLLKKIGKALDFEDKESQWSLIGLNLIPNLNLNLNLIPEYFATLCQSSSDYGIVIFLLLSPILTVEASILYRL